MYWNHRVIEAVAEDGTKYYGIHEVYYDNDGNPKAYTENAVGIMWEEGDSPTQILEWMANCLNKPVLKKSDFPNQPFDWGDDNDLASPKEIAEIFKVPTRSEDEPR